MSRLPGPVMDRLQSPYCRTCFEVCGKILSFEGFLESGS